MKYRYTHPDDTEMDVDVRPKWGRGHLIFTKTERGEEAGKKTKYNPHVVDIGLLLTVSVAALRHYSREQRIDLSQVVKLIHGQTTAITGGANTIFMYVPPHCDPDRFMHSIKDPARAKTF
jgi:hypothetical protein